MRMNIIVSWLRAFFFPEAMTTSSRFDNDAVEKIDNAIGYCRGYGLVIFAAEQIFALGLV